MTNENDLALFTPAGRDMACKRLEQTGTELVTREDGFFDQRGKAALSDSDVLQMLRSPAGAESEEAILCDKAEALLAHVFGMLQNNQNATTFVLGKGGDIWNELKIARERAGRPEPKAE